jgi:hypothetical protein
MAGHCSGAPSIGSTPHATMLTVGALAPEPRVQRPAEHRPTATTVPKLHTPLSPVTETDKRTEWLRLFRENRPLAATRRCQAAVALRTDKLLPALLAFVVGACSPGSFDDLLTDRELEERAREAGAAPAPRDGDAEAALPDGAGPSTALPNTPLDASSVGGDGGRPATAMSDAALMADARTSQPAIDAAIDARAVPPALDSGSGTATPDTGPVIVPPVGESACYDKFQSRLACEGFEAELAAPWWPGLELGAVSRSARPTHVGDGALRAVTTAANGHAFAGRPTFARLTSGTMYLRSYVFVPSGVPLNGVVVHGMSEELAPYGGVSILLSDQRLKLDVHPEGPGVNPVFVDGESGLTLPRDRWNCLQMQVSISPTGGAVRLSVNGKVAVESVGTLRTLPASGYWGITAGIVYMDPKQAPLELFVDEVVADLAPIPCD